MEIFVLLLVSIIILISAKEIIKIIITIFIAVGLWEQIIKNSGGLYLLDVPRGTGKTFLISKILATIQIILSVSGAIRLCNDHQQSLNLKDNHYKCMD